MKTVLITGASRGIGKALGEKFLKEGFFVMGTSTDGIFEWTHENLQTFSLSLEHTSSIDKSVEEIKQFGKKIDILINNAGSWSNDDDDNTFHPEQMRRTLEINLIGPADFTEKLLHTINHGGHIINVSSRAGSMGYVRQIQFPDYRISKAALNMFTRLLSIREANKFIVSSVHPGWVKTDMGGEEADIYPEEAAEDIYKLAISNPESGQFWFKGEKFPW